MDSEMLNTAKKFSELIRLKFRDKIKDIIVFGSVARHEETEMSDIDILVITKISDFRLKHSIISEAFDMSIESGHYISVKVLDETEYQKKKYLSFFRNISADGIAV
ncbi:nucleotidyltransferase domain-containing protein [Methanoplanus limicola]|nr:nucleotidyltransferase domain-containing protein [Methanoplanus limicola]